MTINMNDDSRMSIAQIKEFAKLTKGNFKINNKQETYECINKTIVKFHYFR